MMHPLLVLLWVVVLYLPHCAGVLHVRMGHRGVRRSPERFRGLWVHLLRLGRCVCRIGQGWGNPRCGQFLLTCRVVVVRWVVVCTFLVSVVWCLACARSSRV